MCGINHQACCGAVLLNKLRKNPVKDPQSAPADKTIVESFVWSILARSIFPLQAVLDDIDNAADDTPVIDSRNAMGTRKVAFDTNEKDKKVPSWHPPYADNKNFLPFWQLMSPEPRYDWPGNIRELENVIIRLTVEGSLDFFSPSIGKAQEAARTVIKNKNFNLKQNVALVEKEIILKALEQFHWNRQRTAKELGITRVTLFRKMKDYGMLEDS